MSRTLPVNEEVSALTHLLERNHRVLLGVAGAPGAGKSTYAARLVKHFEPGVAVVVPVDGFSLSNAVLDSHGASRRKGAIDTYDVGGLLSVLDRLRSNQDDFVLAPDYRRELDEPIAAAIQVMKHVRLVIVEGNYLLTAEPGWDEVRLLLDEVWFLDTPDDVRAKRLHQRYPTFGATYESVLRWATGTDPMNARLVQTTRSRASRIVQPSTVWPDRLG